MEKLSLKRSMKKKLRQFFNLRFFWVTWIETDFDHSGIYDIRVWRNYFTDSMETILHPLGRNASWKAIQKRNKS